MPAPAGSGRSSYRWLTVALATAAGVYAWYVVNQYGRFNDLNQRELSTAAAELQRAVENAVGTVRNFKPGSDNENALCDFDADQPYLALDADSACQRKIKNLTDAALTTDNGLAVEASVVPSTASGDKNRNVRFVFRTDVLLQELSFPESFQLIFVGAESGAVLYQDAPGQRRWLRHLRWGEQGFRDAGANQSGSQRIQNLADVLGGEPAWKTLRSMSARTTLELGGGWHQLYLQPLVIDNGHKFHLILGGAVPVEALIRQALAVDTYFLAVMVFLLLLCILGYPFVKLTSLGRRERFTLRDVYLLYLSTGALLALVTFAVLGFDGYVRWYEAADKGLKELAVETADHFAREVSAIRKQLDEYDRQVSGMKPRDCEKWPVHHRWFEDSGELSPPDLSIYVEQVAWVGPNGRQIWKSTADVGGAKVSVPQRAYFRAVRDGNLFQIHGPDDTFFIGPDRSITDGKFYTFLSISSSITPGFCTDGGAAGGRYTAVATTKLLSLDRPPLPAGYGFALVNREGRVLVHSDPRLSLRENFYEELSEGPRVRAIMFAGHAGLVTSRYRERPHELYLFPLGFQRKGEPVSAGFYLATFRDISVERAVVARVFVVGLAGPMLILVTIMFVSLTGMAWASRYRDERWNAWLWPHGGLDRMYKLLTTAFAAALLTGLGFYWLGAGEVMFLILPVAAAVGGIGIYLTRGDTARRKLGAPAWHAAALVLLLVCMVIAPASALFRFALGNEFGKLILTEQEWMDAQRRDSALAIEAEARAEKYPETTGVRLVAARKLYFAKAPAPYNVEPRLLASGPGFLSTILWLDEGLPIENDYAARQRYQDRQYSYSPAGTLPVPFAVSGAALASFAVLVALLVVWIRWNTNRLFYADQETREPLAATADQFENLWNSCSADEHYVLLQVVRETIANPYQRSAVTNLLDRGLLILAPDLRPFSRPFEQFLRLKAPHMEAELREWEASSAGYSWRYMRLIFVALVGGLAFFLVATQPGLQSGLLGIATGITGVLAAGLKLRDAIGSWVGDRK